MPRTCILIRALLTLYSLLSTPTSSHQFHHLTLFHSLTKVLPSRKRESDMYGFGFTLCVLGEGVEIAIEIYMGACSFLDVLCSRCPSMSISRLKCVLSRTRKCAIVYWLGLLTRTLVHWLGIPEMGRPRAGNEYELPQHVIPLANSYTV